MSLRIIVHFPCFPLHNLCVFRKGFKKKSLKVRLKLVIVRRSAVLVLGLSFFNPLVLNLTLLTILIFLEQFLTWGEGVFSYTMG